jgi:hypothetical protein
LIGDVGQLFADAGFARDAGALRREPQAEGFDQRPRAVFTDGQAFGARAAADLGFDAVESGDLG